MCKILIIQRDENKLILYKALCYVTKIYNVKRFRLYIKQHFSHPPMDQSVAIVYSTDGLNAKQTSLTVFISIAIRLIV